MAFSIEIFFSDRSLASSCCLTTLFCSVATLISKAVERQEQTNEPSFKNISIENATYLQNMENIPINEEYLKKEDEISNFEVDSIELANPQLFSDDEEINTTNPENKDEKAPEIFESQDSEENSEIKEPEMFESSDLEDDLEIPAFLRRQKN